MFLGGYIPNKTTTIRFVVGSWCLLTLVLLNVYNGTLISYVTETRNEKPLIYSYHDIVTNPHVNLVVVKGTGIDVVVSVSEEESQMNSTELKYETIFDGCRQLLVVYINRSPTKCALILIPGVKQQRSVST